MRQAHSPRPHQSISPTQLTQRERARRGHRVFGSKPAQTKLHSIHNLRPSSLRHSRCDPSQRRRMSKPGMAHISAEPRAGHCRIAAIDLFVVPTKASTCSSHCSVRPERLGLCQVTTSRTVEWIACQLTEAFPWNEAPRYLIRDRDRIYGAVVVRRMRAMGIRDKPAARPRPGRMALPNG